MKEGGNVDVRHEATLWGLLHIACYAGQHEVVRALVAAGAKLERQVEGQYNPLLLCCSCGSPRLRCPRFRHPKADAEDPSDFICGHLKVGRRDS